MNFSLRLLLFSQADYGFTESSTTSCCTTCKNDNPRSTSACTNWISGSPSHKLQWFLTDNSGVSWRDNTLNDRNNGVFPTANLANKRYSVPCRMCPPGWYKEPASPHFCKCTLCSTGFCPAGLYMSTSCNSNSNQQCSACSTCGVGQESVSQCSHAQNTVCRSCLTGTYRDQNVVNEQEGCRTCTTCQTSQRQRRTGCTASSNEQCPQCPEGNIVVLRSGTPEDPDTCQACGPGTFASASDNTCATCKNCANTEKQTGACLATGDRQCTACDEKTRVRSLNSQTCDGCVDGYYRTDVPSCAPCAESSCGEGRYKQCFNTIAEGGQQNCFNCQGQEESTGADICAAGRGVTERCSGAGTVNVQCADCPAGTERPVGTMLADKIQKCLNCGLGKFKALQGTQNCGDCTNKPVNTQYVAWPVGTMPSSNTCEWCVSGMPV